MMKIIHAFTRQAIGEDHMLSFNSALMNAVPGGDFTTPIVAAAGDCWLARLCLKPIPLRLSRLQRPHQLSGAEECSRGCAN